MTTPKIPETTVNALPPLPVLYFDANGNGPDEVYLQFETLELRLTGKAANLGLRIHAGEITALIPTGGGFLMDRDQVATMHAQLAEWLAKHPASTDIGTKEP